MRTRNLLAALVLAASANASTVLLTTFGSVGTGGNDTSVFQTAINTTAGAHNTLEIPSGNYNISTLNIPSNANILVDSGATMTATAGFSAGQVLLDVENASNVTFTGTPGASVFQMRKSSYTDGSEYRHCLNIVSSSNVTINGISCNLSGGDGLYIAGSSSNIDVENSTFDHDARNALSVISVNGLTVNHCTFSNTSGNSGLAPDGPWDGIDMEPNVSNDRLQNILIENSTISGNAGNGLTFSADRQSSAAGADSVTINNVTSSGNGTGGIRNGSNGFTFFNEFSNSPNNPFGTVLLENSTSTNDGGWGVDAAFWDYSTPGITLTVQNVTITNPWHSLSGGDAAFGVSNGGGDAAPAGNISYCNMVVHYTGGGLPYYFDATVYNAGGYRNINIVGTTGTGQTGSSLGLYQGNPSNGVGSASCGSPPPAGPNPPSQLSVVLH